jgi:cell division control protein 6
MRKPFLTFMGLFKDMLGSGETIFKNDLALGYDFLPKLLPFREKEQRRIVSYIAPLTAGRDGRNAIIYGAPGIGKTAAVKFVLRDLEDETEGIEQIYVNCWQKNTSHKVITEICELLEYRLTHNKKTEELVQIIKTILNKKAAVFCFETSEKKSVLSAG